MLQLTHVLKINPSHIKACILYEVLQKKPVYDSYRNFSKTIGDDVMHYVDFEYWFYKFYNGNVNFDDVRCNDQMTLMGLPLEVMSKIAEKLDPVERTPLRLVSKDLKTICDIQRPIFNTVNMTVFKDQFHLYLNEKLFLYSAGKNGLRCIVQKHNGPQKPIRRDFLMHAVEDTKRILSLPKIQINHLSVTINEHIFRIPSIFPKGLNVKSIEIVAPKRCEAFMSLPDLQPGKLEKIKLSSAEFYEGFGPLIIGNQFKQAKEVDVKDFGVVTSVEELKNFSHLAKFEVTFDNITAEIARGIQDMLSNSKYLENCYIQCNIDNVAHIARSLGSYVPDNNDTIVHYRHRIGRSEEFLVYEIRTSGMRVKKVYD